MAAAGAKPNLIEAFTCFKQAVTADAILAGKAFPGRKIIIIGGGSVGCETAEYLAPLVNDRFVRNRDITVLEMAPEILMAESGSGRSVLVQRMMAKGVHIECSAKVTKVTEDTITYEQGGVEHVITDADTLVFANGYHVDPAIEEMLKATNVHYHLIGDGEKVGNLRDAITRAYEVVKNI